jgi:hypothetical protein
VKLAEAYRDVRSIITSTQTAYAQNRSRQTLEQPTPSQPPEVAEEIEEEVPTTHFEAGPHI